MGRKKLFSLIEIAVAMAVAAIGVAAIMALLPVALKSTSDSVGDTLAADAANTVFAQMDRYAWENFKLIRDLPTSKPTSTFGSGDQKKYSEWIMNAESESSSETSYNIEMGSEGLKHFAFLFGRPGKQADFAAEVFCWRDADNKNKLTVLNDTGAQEAVNIPKNKSGEVSMVRVYIEISWPIAKKYKAGTTSNPIFPRQSRTFVRDFFDPKYSNFATD